MTLHELDQLHVGNRVEVFVIDVWRPSTVVRVSRPFARRDRRMEIEVKLDRSVIIGEHSSNLIVLDQDCSQTRIRTVGIPS